LWATKHTTQYGHELVFCPCAMWRPVCREKHIIESTASWKCGSSNQRSRLDVDKDILTVFVKLPPYDELSFLRNNHGLAEWFRLARPARQDLRMQEMSVVRDKIS